MGSYKDQKKTSGTANNNKLLFPGINYKSFHQKDGGITLMINPEVEEGKELGTFELDENGKPSSYDSDFTLWMLPLEYYHFTGPKKMSYAVQVEGDPKGNLRSAFAVFHTAMYNFAKKDNKAPAEWREWVADGKYGPMLSYKAKAGCLIQATVKTDAGKKVDPRYAEKCIMIGSSSVREAFENLANWRDDDNKRLYPDLVSSANGSLVRVAAEEDDPDNPRKTTFRGYEATIEKDRLPRDPKKALSDWIPWADVVNYMTQEQQIATLRINFGPAALGKIFRDDPDFSTFLTASDVEAWPALQRKERARLRAELAAEEAEDAAFDDEEPTPARKSPKRKAAPPPEEDEYGEEVEEEEEAEEEPANFTRRQPPKRKAPSLVEDEEEYEEEEETPPPTPKRKAKKTPAPPPVEEEDEEEYEEEEETPPPTPKRKPKKKAAAPPPPPEEEEEEEEEDDEDERLLREAAKIKKARRK